jgi:hypothetical protein
LNFDFKKLKKILDLDFFWVWILDFLDFWIFFGFGFWIFWIFGFFLGLDFGFFGFLDFFWVWILDFLDFWIFFGFWVSHPNPIQKPNFFWVRTSGRDPVAKQKSFLSEISNFYLKRDKTKYFWRKFYGLSKN